MGAASSRIDKALIDELPPQERYYGLQNFGNTCYCNSVLQALYFLQPFRDHVLKHCSSRQPEDHLLFTLAELFSEISSQKKRTGIIAPKKFIRRVRADMESFRNYHHQDAHEFLNFLLNLVHEILAAEFKLKGEEKVHLTFIEELFGGVLTGEIKCLSCENVTHKDESFLDLSLDILENASLTACLRNFSSVETLSGDDKFYCEGCCSLQEAQKRMVFKRLPQVLVIHLKRFKFIEHLQRFQKLYYRVSFPSNLVLEDSAESYRCYNLFAVVTHIGSGPSHGHYYSFVKSGPCWLLFDDDQILPVSEEYLKRVFGVTESQSRTKGISERGTGYILLYEADLNRNFV